MSYENSSFDVSVAREEFQIYLAEGIEAKDYLHVIPAWQHLIHAVRVLHRHHPLWGFNAGDGGRLWVAKQGVFLAWVSAWQDIQLLLGKGHPASWTDYRIVARQLLIDGAIISSTGQKPIPLWLGSPFAERSLSGGRGRAEYIYMLNINSPELIFDKISESISISFKGQ
jgi:hypothetical protein